MNRLQKKCLIASTGLHLFLFVLLIFGTAFVHHDEPNTMPPLRAIPTRLVDAALSGGGGNPRVAPSDAQQKGQTLTPPPIQPTPPPPPTPQPRHAEQPARPVASKPEPRVDKPKPVKPPKEPIREVPRPVADAKPKTSKTDEIMLKPITRTTTDKAKERADAEAKAAADAAAAASRKAAKEFAKAAEQLKSGFSKGTAVEISGPGGEVYANYDQWVKERYDNAWLVSPDLANDDAVAVVRITIARSGKVVSHEIIQRSGNSALDRSVRRALDEVKFIAPFPEGAREEERTYTIEFNLKTKRLLG